MNRDRCLTWILCNVENPENQTIHFVPGKDIFSKLNPEAVFIIEKILRSEIKY